LKEARQRRDAEEVAIGDERRLQLLQRAVGLGLDQREDALGLRACATQRIALDTATRKCAAAFRRDMPPSTAATTRLRRSTERDAAMPAGLLRQQAG
jgi:hypothetical protein